MRCWGVDVETYYPIATTQSEITTSTAMMIRFSRRRELRFCFFRGRKDWIGNVVCVIIVYAFKKSTTYTYRNHCV